ncbi:MAG: MFS transporter [Clostridia bacterium]|nr:MFS transporter [Clostridia bacterium]
MAQEQPVKKNRYCWVIFIIACLAGLCGVGLITNTYGMFMGPIAEDLGVAKSSVSLLMTIASWSTVAFYFLGGKAFAKWGVRRVSTIAGFILAAGLLLYSLSTQLWHFYLVAVLCGGTSAFAALNVVPILINNWFVKHRALVLGIAMMMTGLGGAIYNPLFANIITNEGWRMGYRVAACIALLFPIIGGIFMRTKPADIGLLPFGFEDSEEMKDLKGQVHIKEFPGIPKKYAYKSPALWLAFITIMFTGFSSGFNQHWVNCGVTYGYTLVQASFIATAALISAAIFKVVGGFLNDSKLGPRNTHIIFCLAGIVAMVMMMAHHNSTNHSLMMIAVCSVIYGMNLSLMTMQGPVIIRNIFGMRDYGVIYPIVNMGMSIGTGLTYSLNAVLLEAVGSYMGSYVFNSVVIAVSLVMCIATFAAGKKAKEKFWRAVGDAL